MILSPSPSSLNRSTPTVSSAGYRCRPLFREAPSLGRVFAICAKWRSSPRNKRRCPRETQISKAYRVRHSGDDCSCIEAVRLHRHGNRQITGAGSVQDLRLKKLRHWLAGQHAGIADVIVSHVDWPKNVWHMLEIKKPGGKRRQEQIDLALYGASIFVESVYATLAEVCRFEHKTLKLTINQRLFDVSQQFWDKETESMIANARQGVSS